MKYEHKELIHKYLNIDKRIKDIKKRIDYSRMEFEAQSYHGRMDFDVMGVFMKGFKVDTRVINYVDYIRSCERNIAKNKRRMHYFKRFTDTLDPHTYSSLKRRYSSIKRLDDMQELGHDEQVLDEILEIEEAISHEFDFEKLPEFDFEKLPEFDKKTLLVELNDLEPDTLEESFDTMLKILGV